MKYTEENMAIMREWLKSKRIAFEFVNNPDIPHPTVEIKLVDYKNNCLLLSAKYPATNLNPESLRMLVFEFEKVLVFPILFDDVKFHDRQPPDIRLIRED